MSNNLETKRLEFHTLLVGVLGSNHVYFQPPESTKIVYPAIIYERYDIPTKEADNLIYLKGCKYRVIYVDKDPTSEIVDKLASFDRSRYNRHYIVDGLHHDVFTIYY